MYIIIAIVGVILLTSFVVLRHSRFGKLPEGIRLERILSSPNYQNGEFTNQSVTPTLTDDNGFKTFVSFFISKKDRVTPIDSIPIVKTDLKTLDPQQDILIWLGHSSYFMQIDGKRLLVDPILSGFASPFSWMIKAFNGSHAYQASDMPDIDYLIITHDHWDHLDYDAAVALKPKIKQVICPLGVGSHLQHWGYQANAIVELDWHQQATLDSGWVVNATPARHFSGRGFKRNQTLWASFVLQTPTLKLFIGGDGGYDKHFAEIGQQYGPFDLALLEQGQYDKRWRYIHLLPSEVFQAATDLNTKRLMTVHHAKFALGNHPWHEPLNQLIENSQLHHIPVLTPMIGEPVNLNDTTQQFSHWWVGLE